MSGVEMVSWTSRYPSSIFRVIYYQSYFTDSLLPTLYLQLFWNKCQGLCFKHLGVPELASSSGIKFSRKKKKIILILLSTELAIIIDLISCTQKNKSPATFVFISYASIGLAVFILHWIFFSLNSVSPGTDFSLSQSSAAGWHWKGRTYSSLNLAIDELMEKWEVSTPG